MTIVHSLWVSKLRYGLQLCTKLMQQDEDRKSAAMKSLQLTQNRSRIRDRVSVSSMLTYFDLLSINQLANQI